MKYLLCLILLPLMALVCPEAEIVSWKIPLSCFVGAGLQANGIVRCKTAPEPSPFFKEGDALWDLKGIPAETRKETSPPLDWVIWNASSGRLVVKADWLGIWQLLGRLRTDQQPKQCRLTVEVLEVPADGSLQTVQCRRQSFGESGEEFGSGGGGAEIEKRKKSGGGQFVASSGEDFAEAR